MHGFYLQILESQVILEDRLKKCDLPVPLEEVLLNNDVDLEPPPEETTPKRKRQTVYSDKQLARKEQIAEEDRIIKQFYGLSCQKCVEGPSFETLPQLRDHMRSIHSTKVTTIVCCSKMFKKRVQLLDHAKIHISPHELTCQDCGKVCHNRYRLKEHQIQRHAPEDAKNYPCPECKRRFLTSSNVRAHMKVHMTEEEKEAKRTHRCEICNSGFMSKSVLAHHDRQVHQNAYACVCEICAKTFKTKMHFLSHFRQSHVKQVSATVQCPVCGKWMGSEQRLKKHVRLNHDNPGPHICKECGKEKPSQIALTSHIRYMHKSVDKFKCQFCIKCFKKPIHLKEHLTTHMGGVLYRCDYCEKTFNYGANYSRHRKQKHPEEVAKEQKKTNFK